MIDTANTETRLEALKAELDTLQTQFNELSKNLANMRSANFIEANGISQGDVEMSTGYGKPWFGNTEAFGIWLRTNKCSTRFAEWNGRLHYTTDIIAGFFKPTPGRIGEVPPS